MDYKQYIGFVPSAYRVDDIIVYTGVTNADILYDYHGIVAIYDIQILVNMLRKFPTTLFFECNKLSWCWEFDNYNRIYINKDQFTIIMKCDAL